jgi:hypothetical protein
VRLHELQQNFRGWLTSEAAVDFGERAQPGLAVYLNNYRAQLLSCLSTSYPMVRSWIGDAAFEGAAATHIDRTPPHSWTLDAYGLDFSETLDAIYPHDAEVGELARLERELGLAFVGRDALPVDPSSLTEIDWDRAIIQLVPTLTLLPVTTNVGALWSALHDEETPPPALRLPEPTHLAVWRDGFASKFRTVAAEEAAVLAQIRGGKSFGDICATLVERLGEEAGPAAAGAMLSQWLTHRLIENISGSQCLKP